MKSVNRRKQKAYARGAAAVALSGLALGVAVIAPQSAHAQAAPGITLTPLHSFGSRSDDGIHPYNALTMGSDGNFYGVTYDGGSHGYGSVFTITPGGTESTLHSFTGGNDGANPKATLTLGSDGSLYGTTEQAGSGSGGTIFKITTGGTLTTLYTFNGSNDGMNPTSSVVFDNSGNLYGTCNTGGANNDGTVYRLDTSFTLTVLHNFNGSDGENPIGGVTLGSDGMLYGTALSGLNGDGVIYQVMPDGTYNVIHSFTGSDGMDPEAPLITGADGSTFYGTTVNGGASGDGTIFKVTASGTLTSLYSFSGASDGANPYGALLKAQGGSFYGMTRHGGPNSDGTIFSISSTGTLTSLYKFSADPSGGNSDGAFPYGALAKGAGGKVYGLTNRGGANNDGIVFSLSGSTGTGTRFDFDGDGNADLLWYNNSTGGVSIWNMNDTTVLNYGGTFASVPPSTGWVPVAAPTVASGGSPSLMWWNKNSGELSLWTLQNEMVTQFGGDFATITDTNWMPVAIADDMAPMYNLVFQNTSTGDISAWKMNSESVTQFGGTIASLGSNSPWTVVGAPDLDGDGKSDLLFYNTSTGEVSYWSCDLSNDTVLAFHGDIAQVSDTAWRLVGSEDLNGDGYSDLIWHNQVTGAVSRWLLNGATVEQYGGAFAHVSDLDWRPQAIR